MEALDARTLSEQGSSNVHLEELACVKLDIAELSGVRRIGEGFKIMNSGNITATQRKDGA